MGEPSYIVVGEIGSTDEPVELPIRPNGTVPLATVTAYYPDAVSLRYRGASGEFQRLRLNNGMIVAPPDGWRERKYYITIYRPESSQEYREIMSTPASLEDGELVSSATSREEGEIRSSATSQEEGPLSDEDAKKGNDDEGDIIIIENDEDEDDEEENETKDEEAGIDLSDDDILSEGDVNPDGISEEEEEELKDLMTKKYKPVRKPHEDIIVFGLPWDARTPLLKNYFKQYGRVLYAYVKRWRYPKDRKMSGRYGFINFHDWEVAKKVLKQIHHIGGKQVNIRLAKKSEDQGGESISERKRTRDDTYGNQGSKYGTKYKYSKYGNGRDNSYNTLRNEFANLPVVYNHLAHLQYGKQGSMPQLSEASALKGGGMVHTPSVKQNVLPSPQQQGIRHGDQQYGSYSNPYGSVYGGPASQSDNRYDSSRTDCNR